MERINGDANIAAIDAAVEVKVPRFVYISTVENNLPQFFLKGYFQGKKRTENHLIKAFGNSGRCSMFV